MLSRIRSWRVATFTSWLTAIVVVFLITASGVSLYSSYKFDLDLVNRSQKIIATSLQKGGLPFAVATQDRDFIESIIDTYLQHREVYALEIKSVDGNTIYRKNKKLSESAVKITPKILPIISPYKSVSVDEFDNPDSKQTPLGTITIYYSNEELDNSIFGQVLFVGGILCLAIILVSLMLLFFNRSIMRYLDHIVRVMEAIKKGNKLAHDGVYLSSLHELRIIEDSLRRLSTTIYERDARLKDSLQEAIDAKISSEQAEHFKDDFIRSVSHDIRTPVGVVVNLLGLIMKESHSHKLARTFVDKLNACYQSAKVLNDVTSELFNFDQFQNKEIVENRAQVDLQDFFTRIACLYKNKFENKNIGYFVQNENRDWNSPSRFVVLDQGKLTLILKNLIDNALKFTPYGSVIVTWSTADGVLHVCIKDSGIGISEEKLNVIFERYTQLLNPISTHHEGRGLGLFYVKRLTNVIGATISVTSREGLGSVFTLKVPFSQAKPEDEKPLQGPVQVVKNRWFAGVNTSVEESLKVLIIDDDEPTCFTLKEMLAQYNIDCGIENIPEIGYNRLIRDEPDLVFIDYHMTGLSGDRLAQKAQKIISSKAIFFVCITAETNKKSIDMLNSIFQEVYLKPFDPDQLEKIISQVISAKQITCSILSKIHAN